MTTTDELLERIEELEHEQAQLRQQYEQTKEQYQQVTGLFEQFKTGTISRRAFLTSVTALAGVGFAAGSASAAPDYTSASGVAGTEAQPLSSANVQQLNAQQIGSDTVRFTGYADTLDANVVSTDGLDYNNLIPDYRTAYYQPEHLDSDPTTTSTSYQNVFDIHGYFSPSDIPPNATLYGKFTTRMRNDTSNETTFAVPTGTDDGSLVDITELEVSVTSTTSTLVSSGWQELTSIQGMTEFTGFSRIAGKVSAGTGTYSRFSPGLEIAGSIQ